MDDKDFLAPGRICGFRMFNLGTYPGIEYGDGEVLGELYIVSDETLAKLDMLEEEGTLYRRTITRVDIVHNEYEAFCFDEACEYIIRQLEDKKTPKWREERQSKNDIRNNNLQLADKLRKERR